MAGDRRPLIERFWSYVDKHGPYDKGNLGRCWYWTGALGRDRGYMRIAGVKRPASHVAWFLRTGQWPTQLMLHKCDVPVCVRFSHLFQGTHKDNSQDMAKKGRGCKSHPHLSAANTSGFKGVHWDASKDCWIAKLSVRGCTQHIGRFEHAIQAAFAYDAAATEVLGMLAITNA